MLAETSTSTGNVIAVPDTRPWILPLSAIAVLSLLWGVVYRSALASAVAAWWVSPTYSHCFLIVPIAVYLVWLKRHELACQEPRAALWPLLLMVPAGIGWLVGTFASVNEIQQLSAVAMYQVMLLAILGLETYRSILFPALMLFFLVPMGEYLVLPLQSLTTAFVSAGLSALNILHHTEGNVIELENGRFLVAEACAGLRFLIANIVLCAIFSYFVFRRPGKIILFMLAALVVPIAANCVRALGIVLIAHWTDNRLAVGADHLIYGWGFSVIILLLLFGFAIRFRDPGVDTPLIRWRQAAPRAPARPVTAMVLAAAMLVLPAALIQVQAAAFPADQPSIDFRLPAGWRKAEAHSWSPQFPGADKQVHVSLRHGAQPPIAVAVGYYGSAHPAAMPESQLWQEGKFNPLATAVRRQGRTAMREVVLSNPEERRLLWWAYWKDGTYTASAIDVKLLTLQHTFGPHTGTALIALSTRVTVNDDEARARLRSALWALNAISAPEQR